MERCWLLLVFLLTFSVNPMLQAQKAEIGGIIDRYVRVQEQILRNDLYSNTFQLNGNELDWNNALFYKQVEEFFFQRNVQGEARLQLVKVTIDSARARYQIEYLYNPEGKLIHCIEQQDDPQFTYRKLRVYFQDEELLQLSEDNVIINSSTIFHSEKVQYIRESALFYRKKFRDYMGLLEKNP